MSPLTSPASVRTFSPLSPAGAAWALRPRQLDAGLSRNEPGTARVSSEHYPAIYRGSARMVRVDLGGRGAESTIWLLTRLQRLERDPTWAVVIIPADLRGSWATADELRQAVLRLRAAGKHVFSYSGTPIAGNIT